MVVTGVKLSAGAPRLRIENTVLYCTLLDWEGLLELETRLSKPFRSLPAFIHMLHVKANAIR